MQPDMVGMAWQALTLLLEPMHLLILVLGVLIGLAIGVLPGLSGIVGLAMLIPFTYSLDAPTAFALLLGMAAVITSSDFITAVLFGVPGHVGAAATVIDGHADGAQGRGGSRLRRRLCRVARSAALSAPSCWPSAFRCCGRCCCASARPSCWRFTPVRPLDGRRRYRQRAAQGADRGRSRTDDCDDRLALADRHAALDLRHALSLGRPAAGAGDARAVRNPRVVRARGRAQAHRRRHRYFALWPMGRRARRHAPLVAGAPLQCARQRFSAPCPASARR